MTDKIPKIPKLLKQYGIHPNKKLGQNFLVDETHLDSIIKAADLKSDDTVLEIGAGLGSLTLFLAKNAKNVIAVEMDQTLIPILQANLTDYPNVRVIQGDILSFNIDEHLQTDNYQVVANIPYYLTSKLIRYLLESQKKPRGITLTMQKEVGERACGQAPNMSMLALSVQMYGDAKIVHHIPPGAFYPVPKVESAVLNMDIFEKPLLGEIERDEVFRLARAAFQQKRKMLANSLSSLPEWDKTEVSELLQSADIDPYRRPETVSLEEWISIVKAKD